MKKTLKAVCAAVTRLFGVWILAVALASLRFPGLFRPALPHVSLLLGLIMFGMGLTLSAEDFHLVMRRPRYMLAGAAAQFTIMPLAGYALAVLFDLPPELAVGVVLVGAAPGGTASNVITWFARGDVPLSVAMTSVSTLLAPAATPLLVLWLAGRWVPVPAAEMFLSVLKIILVPVVAGLLVHRLFPRLVRAVEPGLPLVSVAGIVVIVGAVVGVNAERIAASAGLMLLLVFLHNAIGLVLGYAAGAAIRMGEPQRRALSIEVGMQNSGLAVSLALTHFSPPAALAGALFSVWQNLSGSLLATVWARRGGGAKDQCLVSPSR